MASRVEKRLTVKFSEIRKWLTNCLIIWSEGAAYRSEIMKVRNIRQLPQGGPISGPIHQDRGFLLTGRELSAADEKLEDPKNTSSSSWTENTRECPGRKLLTTRRINRQQLGIQKQNHHYSSSIIYSCINIYLKLYLFNVFNFLKNCDSSTRLITYHRN